MTASEFRIQLATLFAQGVKSGDMDDCIQLARDYHFYMPTAMQNDELARDQISYFLTGQSFDTHVKRSSSNRRD